MINRVSNIAQEELLDLPPIVCIGFPRWEGTSYLSSTVQLMTELAKTQKILYVDYPFTYKDIWHAKNNKDSGIPLAELSSKAPVLQKRILKNGQQIHLLRMPPFIPANFFKSSFVYDQLLAWNARKAKRAILKALKELSWVSPIVINAFNPALGNALAGKLGESQLIYYCYDEISAAPWIARHGARHEAVFLPKVDKTVVSSTGLYATKQKQTPNCFLIKNGVDLSVFVATSEKPEDLPDGKIIGYIGTVGSRLDYDLLLSIAKAYPEHKLVILGRVMNEMLTDDLKRLSNVFILGTRPTDQLGNYVQAFNVGLIPFIKNDLTAGIYPLKINEYLALGVPVVSTDFADLSDFEDHCHIGRNKADFLLKIEEALKDTNPDRVRERKDFAAKNTWSNRADQFVNLLSGKIGV